MGDLAIKFTGAAYQRNGVSGEGFWHIRFSFKNDGKRVDAQCVLFEDVPGCCAIITDDMTQHWRGDHFEPAMKAFVNGERASKMAGPHLRRRAA